MKISVHMLLYQFMSSDISVYVVISICMLYLEYVMISVLSCDVGAFFIIGYVAMSVAYVVIPMHIL